MASVDPNYDYTKPARTYDGETPFDSNPAVDDGLGDYEISDDVSAPNYTADEIVQESGFESIPPGDHELIVIGFLIPKDATFPIVTKHKDAFFGERRISYRVDTVGVKLANVANRSQQIVFYTDLPPGDPEGQKCYTEGIPKEGGKPSTKGFQAKIFYQFLEHGLGYPYPKGGKLSPEARNLRNWIGHRMLATVNPGDEYEDAATKQMKTGKPRIKLFSFRPTSETTERMRRAGELAPVHTRPTVGERAAKINVATPAKAPVAAPAGLDDI